MTTEINVPAFTFERIPEGIRCGVQDASHGTFSDVFPDIKTGGRWIEDVLVAYFSRTYERASDDVFEAVSAAMREGMLD